MRGEKRLLRFLIKQGVPATIIEEKFGIPKDVIYQYKYKLKERKKKRLYPPLAKVLVEEILG